MSICTSLYKHQGVALLRASATPVKDIPGWWPDPDNTASQLRWLQVVWAQPTFARAVRHASPSTARRVDAVVAGRTSGPKAVRNAAITVAKYAIRAAGRPTPFGLFAGVSPVTMGRVVDVVAMGSHHPVARVDTQWLASVVDGLHAQRVVLGQLEVAVSDLAALRFQRWEIDREGGRVSVDVHPGIAHVLSAAMEPVNAAELARSAWSSCGGELDQAWEMTSELVRLGFLVTSLRPPMTCTNPLQYVIDVLNKMNITQAPAAEKVRQGLVVIGALLDRHNDTGAVREGQDALRNDIERTMRDLSSAGRVPLSLDLRLGLSVQLPIHVLKEVQRVASVLVQLSRRPEGELAWVAYHQEFVDRYGVGVMVPLAEVVDPDAGLGFPAGFRGSVFEGPKDTPSDRDQALLELLWEALHNGYDEVELTDEWLASVADAFDPSRVPPHVEVAVQLFANDTTAINARDFSFALAPARSAGTLTSRFTLLSVGEELEAAYRRLPPFVEGALPVQLSFPPRFPHAENVSRVPCYLPAALNLGGQIARQGALDLSLRDLALFATHGRLHIVSRSLQQVVEPQVFHALALRKQAPELARFLAQLPRALDPAWFELDFGPLVRTMPCLPRVRYRRAVLSPRRWRLRAQELGEHGVAGVQAWRERWRCPERVELRDADRTLWLDLTEPMHQSLLLRELRSKSEVVLAETWDAESFGWISGHRHEIAVPLVRAAEQGIPNPLAQGVPTIRSRSSEHLPLSPDSNWLQFKVFGHPEGLQRLVQDGLSAGVASALGPEGHWWFVRYRGTRELDHLRVRVQVDGDAERCMLRIGQWLQTLCAGGAVRDVQFDTYYPELGRYGTGATLAAAEACFVADSRVVTVALQQVPEALMKASVLVAMNFLLLAISFFDEVESAMRWLAERTKGRGTGHEREIADQALRLGHRLVGCEMDEWPASLRFAWSERHQKVMRYRSLLNGNLDADHVLESLLHMHHNRLLGTDRDSEAECRSLARYVAQRWVAQQNLRQIS